MRYVKLHDIYRWRREEVRIGRQKYYIWLPNYKDLLCNCKYTTISDFCSEICLKNDSTITTCYTKEEFIELVKLIGGEA